MNAVEASKCSFVCACGSTEFIITRANGSAYTRRCKAPTCKVSWLEEEDETFLTPPES